MESTNRLRYLIAGTGGVGGSIAGFLSLAGKDVTCIARGAHLQAIQQDGLKLKSDLKGEYALRINACTAEEYNGKAHNRNEGKQYKHKISFHNSVILVC